jgi:hypothetical protein
MTSNTEMIELRRMAEAATPGVWRHHAAFKAHADIKSSTGRNIATTWGCAGTTAKTKEAYESRQAQDRKNAAFIAAANPAKIIELLDALEAQAKQMEVLRKDWKKVSDENGFLRFEQAKQIEALGLALETERGAANLYARQVAHWMSKHDEALKKIEGLQADADMFWNNDDAERQYSSIEEFINDEICNGSLEVGCVFTMQRGKRLPNLTIKITSIDENECEGEYQTIDAVRKQGGEA